MEAQFPGCWEQGTGDREMTMLNAETGAAGVQKPPMSELASAVGTMITRISSVSDKRWMGFDRGDIAALKRMEITNPSPSFWRLVADVLPESANATRWALMAKCMAIMAPNHHAKGVRPGKALAMAGFSSHGDGRMSRLLKADADVFEDFLTPACRYLASKAQPLDWINFAPFVLATDDEKRAKHASALARDFYTNSRVKN
jgi:CRISPR type I-E-associated protein CasB/Cse2